MARIADYILYMLLAEAFFAFITIMTGVHMEIRSVDILLLTKIICVVYLPMAWLYADIRLRKHKREPLTTPDGEVPELTQENFFSKASRGPVSDKLKARREHKP